MRKAGRPLAPRNSTAPTVTAAERSTTCQSAGVAPGSAAALAASSSTTASGCRALAVAAATRTRPSGAWWGPWGGEQAAFDPEANIAVGARVLKEYLVRTRDVTEALQMYAGASDDPDNIYATKVFGEAQRLKQVLRQLRQNTARTGGRIALHGGTES